MTTFIGLATIGIIIILAIWAGSIVLNLLFMVLIGIFSGIAWLFNKATGRN